MSVNLPFPHQKLTLLKHFSTFGIGGPARYFAKASTIEGIQEMLRCAHQMSLPTCILGKGSNSLFDDKGFNGLVILNLIDFLESDAEKGVFCAGSGYSFARLGVQTAKLGFSGLEFAAGIPATVGGAICMNAGANGQETADTLKEVGYVKECGDLVRLHSQDLAFSYRSSSFQKWKGAIVEGKFQLTWSKDAKQEQKQRLNYRLKTQPYKKKSAGCAFRNPSSCSAGSLIEKCGLKGVSIGGALISPIHANFIVNEGDASTQDVLDLIQKIKDQVYKKTGIVLENEIHHIPYE